jgi:hypothetical protein
MNLLGLFFEAIIKMECNNIVTNMINGISKYTPVKLSCFKNVWLRIQAKKKQNPAITNDRIINLRIG